MRPTLQNLSIKNLLINIPSIKYIKLQNFIKNLNNYILNNFIEYFICLYKKNSIYKNNVYIILLNDSLNWKIKKKTTIFTQEIFFNIYMLL